MRSWSDLSSEFEAVWGANSYVRLDYQGGDCEESWRIAGGTSRHLEQRFVALARMAGEKLLELPAAVDWPELVSEQDPVSRWYRALMQLSRAVQVRGPAFTLDEHGNHKGVITLASISGVGGVSSTLCLTLESMAVIPRRRAETICSVPRYSGPCKHWKAAQESISSAEPDYSRAAHEAVSAVEGMCRIILGNASITLGDALKQLRSKGVISPGIIKSIEGLWAFTSGEPGIRHGSPIASAVRPHEAQFVLECCDAVLVMLLGLDEAQ